LLVATALSAKAYLASPLPFVSEHHLSCVLFIQFNQILKTLFIKYGQTSRNHIEKRHSMLLFIRND